MEYVTIENGLVTGHYHSSESQEADVVKVSDWDGVVGSDERLYDWDAGGLIRPEADLITDGLYEDNRGTWYSCTDGGSFVIEEVGVKLPHFEVTQLAPTTPYDEWNGSAWVTNVTLQDKIEKQNAINVAQQKVASRIAETLDKLLGFISSVHTLTVPQQEFVDDFMKDYAAWKDLE